MDTITRELVTSLAAKQVARFTVSLITIIIIIIIIIITILQEFIFKKNNHNTCRNLNTCKTIRSKKKKTRENTVRLGKVIF